MRGKKKVLYGFVKVESLTVRFCRHLPRDTNDGHSFVARGVNTFYKRVDTRLASHRLSGVIMKMTMMMEAKQKIIVPPLLSSAIRDKSRQGVDDKASRDYLDRSV